MGSRRAVVYLILVFLLGLALGGLATVWASKRGYTYDGSKRSRRARGVEWLDGELGLTTEQRREVEAILDEMGEAYRAIRKRIRPEYGAVRQQGREKIRALLDDEQRARFEQLIREIDQKEAQRHRKRDRGRQETPSGGEQK